MSIEFLCNGCGKKLRVKEESAGKRAKCPACATIVTVPQPEAPDDDEYELEEPIPSPQAPRTPPQPAAPSSSPGAGGYSPSAENPYAAGAQNPYSSPQASSEESAYGPRTSPTTEIDVGQVLSRGWTIFKNNAGLAIGAPLVAGFVNQVAGWVMQILIIPAAAIAGDAGVAIMFLLFLPAAILLSAFLNVGQTIIFLKLARGEHAEMSDLFAGGPHLLRYIGVTLVFGLMTSLGYVFCIVPGVIVALIFSQSMILTIDRGLSVGDALSESQRITQGNRLNLFVLFLAFAGIGLLGVLACCIGTIVAVPYCFVCMTVAYLDMTGQPVAA